MYIKIFCYLSKIIISQNKTKNEIKYGDIVGNR